MFRCLWHIRQQKMLKMFQKIKLCRCVLTCVKEITYYMWLWHSQLNLGFIFSLNHIKLIPSISLDRFISPVIGYVVLLFKISTFLCLYIYILAMGGCEIHSESHFGLLVARACWWLIPPSIQDSRERGGFCDINNNKIVYLYASSSLLPVGLQ